MRSGRGCLTEHRSPPSLPLPLLTTAVWLLKTSWYHGGWRQEMRGGSAGNYYLSRRTRASAALISIFSVPPLIPSHSIISYTIIPYHPVSSHLIPFHLILSNHIPFHRNLTHPIPSHLVASHAIPPHLVSSHSISPQHRIPHTRCHLISSIICIITVTDIVCDHMIWDGVRSVRLNLPPYAVPDCTEHYQSTGPATQP